MALKVVILAAGKGTRMKSVLPKVLQPLAGKSLLAHVVATAKKLNPAEIIAVVGHQAELVKQEFAAEGLVFVEQTEQLGTGHAVKQALPYINDDDLVLILYGDVPLTSLQTLENLTDLVTEQSPLALLTIELENPTGYGRIVRENGAIQAIVEQKDASAEQLKINEINTGIMAVKGSYNQIWLQRLDNNNAQGEFYLTDIIAMAVADGFKVASSNPAAEIEVLGVNDKLQLQGLERQFQRIQADDLMRKGATLLDANRLDVRGEVELGIDVQIDANVIFEGKVKLGNNVKIHTNCVLKNVEVGDNTEIHPFSHLEDSEVGESCQIGPYARLRPGSKLAAKAKIGNFVETKNAQIGAGSKVNHLSYVGDTQMGAGVNIGAGTITCNYDGVNKHKTIIGDGVFVGSDTQLVAPVTIEAGATIGAGSTITKNAPADKLTLSRSKQLTMPGWQKPTKK